MPKQEQNWCYTKLNAGLGTVLQSMTSSNLRTIDLVLRALSLLVLHFSILLDLLSSCPHLAYELFKKSTSGKFTWSLLYICLRLSFQHQ